MPIWITEMGSYSGDPIDPQFPPQTERQQAGDYFKRYIYSLSQAMKNLLSWRGMAPPPLPATEFRISACSWQPWLG